MCNVIKLLHILFNVNVHNIRIGYCYYYNFLVWVTVERNLLWWSMFHFLNLFMCYMIFNNFCVSIEIINTFDYYQISFHLIL